VSPLTLATLDGRWAVCWLEPGAPLPPWVERSRRLTSVTRTRSELSIVCDEAIVPPDVRREGGWHALEVAGPLDFSLVGVLSSLVSPLAEAGVSVFAISTFDTDYLLVRDLERGLDALRGAGHRVDGADP